MKRTIYTILFLGMLGISITAEGSTDVTSSILNAGFDGRGFGGWHNNGFNTQTNSDFSGKTFTAYAEKWVSSGNTLPDSYLLQTVTGLDNGKYTLTAAAQNTQNGSASTGAYLIGNEASTSIGTAGTYTVTFYVLDGTAEIGIKLSGCAGNWVCVDNFQLALESSDVSYLRTGLNLLITKAESLTSSSMQGSVLSNLENAITTANSYTSSGSEANVTSAYATLKAAVKDAENSIFYTLTEGGSGTAPTVVGDTRYAVGCNVAFGRSTITSSNELLESGFCFSTTNSTPTVADNRSTRYFSHVGNIYVMDNLEPATCYYIRPYAVTTNYAVGYGDVIRIYTLPQGSISYNFNSSGDEDIDARLKGSMDELIGYWNETTSITGFTPTCNYNSGVATADCQYGGWIRFGPNSAYQATGTAMHEALHGIGVGTDSSWNLHEASSTYGEWYGKRTKNLVQFWDNNTTEYVTGGGSHNWATGGSNMTSYTINGANEDLHTDVQYYADGLFAQAMCEDGMVPTKGGPFLRGYCFQHGDNTKYYIRNTNESYGLNTSTYLYASGSTLKWKTYDSDSAAEADAAAAWYIEFDPSTQYYYFKNARHWKVHLL